MGILLLFITRYRRRAYQENTYCAMSSFVEVSAGRVDEEEERWAKELLKWWNEFVFDFLCTASF